MTNAEKLRRYRAEAVAAGLCQQCRCRPQKPGCKTCVECLARDQRNKPKLLAARRDAGLCKCGAKPSRGYATCSRCRARNAERLRARVAQYVTEDRCHRCGAEPRAGVHYCQPCLDLSSRAATEFRRRNHAAGLCGCGRKPRRGFKSCERCTENQRRHYEKHRKSTAAKTQGRLLGMGQNVLTPRAHPHSCPTARARGVDLSNDGAP